LRVFRLGRNATQAQLAAWLGVRQKSISDWERGLCPIPEGIVAWYQKKEDMDEKPLA
jgi:DNA-binding XRE family transcriptional regulator